MIMKKNLFFFLGIFLFCVLLSGCDSDVEVESFPETAKTEVTLFAGSGIDDDSLLTRSVLDTLGKQHWSLADVINVNGQVSTKTALPGNNTYAAFTVKAASPYYAFYPGNATNLVYNSSTHVFTYDFPATQAYNENSSYILSDGVNPMVATGINPYLSFYNVCGVLKAQIFANISDVSKVRFLSADNAVAGNVTVNPVMKTLTVTGTTKSMDVTFAAVRSLSSATPITVCWVLPTGKYGVGWQIQLLGATGNILSKKVFSTTVLNVNRSRFSRASIWF